MAKVTWYSLVTRDDFKKIDRVNERVQRNSRYRRNAVHVEPDPKPSYGLEDLYSEFRRTARMERERLLDAAERAVGIYYCRICQDECIDGCCAVHGRQYGKRGA